MSEHRRCSRWRPAARIWSWGRGCRGRRSCSGRWSCLARAQGWWPPVISSQGFFSWQKHLSSQCPGGSVSPNSTGWHLVTPLILFHAKAMFPSWNLRMLFGLYSTLICDSSHLRAALSNSWNRTRERSELLSKQLLDLSKEKQDGFWRLADCKVQHSLLSLSFKVIHRGMCKAEPGEKPSIDGIWRTNNFALGPSGPKTDNGLFLKISRWIVFILGFTS